MFTPDFEKTEEISEAQGILVRSAAMHDMEFSPELLAIARAGAGVNNIPLERCAREGIVVFNTPGANANGVKEMVLAGMLLASRDIVEGVDWVRANWNNADIAKTAEKEKKKFAGTELAGKRLGIIGLGAIGVRVANMAVELGMEVFGYDFITIHVPALPSTKGMISREAVKKMKKGVILINMARDVLVDEEAVIEQIGAGRIRRYVSDFPNPTVAGVRGCITTPHLGASTEESEDNCAVMAAEELMDYLENGNIRNSVNYPACSMGVCRSASRIAIFHENKVNMINRLTTLIGGSEVNISEMTSKSKGDVEYTMFDLDAPISKELVDKIAQIPSVWRVRIIK